MESREISAAGVPEIPELSRHAAAVASDGMPKAKWMVTLKNYPKS